MEAKLYIASRVKREHDTTQQDDVASRLQTLERTQRSLKPLMTDILRLLPEACIHLGVFIASTKVRVKLHPYTARIHGTYSDSGTTYSPVCQTF